ncbi:MAG: BNR repeat-containing protein [Prolixibacteraceae bacterium]|nr:BNR repeat-containing protein [Prolixibacteraceae bacterium]
MKNSLLFLAVWLIAFSACAQPDSDDRNKIIDESKNSETVDQVITIDKVWAGHPVGFSLLTRGNRQYIAYYNANRNMVVGQRNLGDPKFELTILPATSRETSGGTSTVLGWDSHNSVTLGMDPDGYIHLAGNMHVHPITYFRSAKPNDISTLKQEMSMVGTNENRCTYPHFMNTREGELIFHYRDGASGSGNEIYNLFNSKTLKWQRLLDTPLTDGLGQMNAYQTQPTLLEDNWYHVYWVWRDTPDCSTNHDLSYIKSPDLKNWFNAFGEPVKLPVTPDNKAVIVDPIPVKGGIINLAASLCFDNTGKPIFAYHKYDQAGNLQFYTARPSGKKWEIRQLTNWDYRWEFSGNGSINNEVRVGAFKNRGDGYYELGYGHIKYGSGTFLLNEKMEICGQVRKPSLPSAISKLEGTFAGLQVRTSSDLGKTENDKIRYMLKWETLPANRDQARPEPWPEASQLYLFKLKKN